MFILAVMLLVSIQMARGANFYQTTPAHFKILLEVISGDFIFGRHAQNSKPQINPCFCTSFFLFFSLIGLLASYYFLFCESVSG